MESLKQVVLHFKQKPSTRLPSFLRINHNSLKIVFVKKKNIIQSSVFLIPPIHTMHTTNSNLMKPAKAKVNRYSEVSIMTAINGSFQLQRKPLQKRTSQSNRKTRHLLRPKNQSPLSSQHLCLPCLHRICKLNHLS